MGRINQTDEDFVAHTIRTLVAQIALEFSAAGGQELPVTFSVERPDGTVCYDELTRSRVTVSLDGTGQMTLNITILDDGSV